MHSQDVIKSWPLQTVILCPPSLGWYSWLFLSRLRIWRAEKLRVFLSFKTTKVKFTFFFPMSFYRHADSYKHHLRIQKNFTIPENSHIVCRQAPHSSPGQVLICFVSIFLLFPECLINGIIPFVICWDWVLSLSKMHLQVTQVSACINSASLCIAERYSMVWTEHNVSTHPSEGT